MPTKSVDQITAATKASADALVEGGNAVIAGFQELAKFYQELATKNAENLTSAIQAISAVKNPSEFTALQQKLIREGVEAAVSDSRKIAELTSSVFNSAFTPVKTQIENIQKSFSK